MYLDNVAVSHARERHTFAAARLTELANGLRVAQVVYVAAELGLADLIAGGLVTCSQLARATSTHPAALNRVLRALCAFGVLSADSEGRFALTEVGVLLCTDAALSFRDAVRFIAGPTRWHCWSNMLETVRTGMNRPEACLGMHLFDYYATHPHESKIESNAMRAFSLSQLGPIIESFDLRDTRTIVDVGGGSGQFLAGILQAFPAPRGILFDRPEVVKHGPEVLRHAGVQDRCEIQAGNFFEAIPPSGDLYLLKQVLHDWDDARAIAILNACRSQLRDGARLIVIERRLPEHAHFHTDIEAILTDLEMLVMTPGGRERSEKEFCALFDRSGLEHVRTVQSAISLTLFEARRRKI